MIPVFTKSNYKAYCDRLAAGDIAIEKMIDTFGYPLFSQRPAGFEGLVMIILEQQVSLTSARSTYRKLKKTLYPITPEGIIRLADDRLKSCGFSRQKIRYVKILAHEILNHDLDLAVLSELSDDRVRERLTAIKGIGIWTCDVYLLFCLNRLDIFPVGDLALMKSMVENKLIHQNPSRADIQNRSLRCKPFRSVFAMILWHSYIRAHHIKLK